MITRERIETTVSDGHLAGTSWGLPQGLREFLQNGRDAAVDGFELQVGWSKGTMTIANTGARLGRESILMGRSTKRDDPARYAGRFGVGKKDGEIVLLRLGKKIKIFNRDEVWTPSLEESERFPGQKVLVYHIETGHRDCGEVRVEVSGVSREEWEATKKYFIFLQKRELNAVKTEHGTLLLGSAWAGKVFVKDILVESDERLQFGYNLTDAQVDRDRQLIARYDLERRLRNIWLAAIALRPELLDDFQRLLADGERDLEGIEYYADCIDEGVRRAICNRFVERHGAKAVPVESLGEAKDLEHLGRRGVVVKRGLAKILGTMLGTAEQVKESLKREIRRHVSWCELTADEKGHLERSVALINEQVPLSLDQISVAEYRSETLLGQYHGGTGDISIAYRAVGDLRLCLETLVHEVAHREGGDGDKTHVAQIERIWSGIAARLIQGGK